MLLAELKNAKQVASWMHNRSFSPELFLSSKVYQLLQMQPVLRAFTEQSNPERKTPIRSFKPEIVINNSFYITHRHGLKLKTYFIMAD